MSRTARVVYTTFFVVLLSLDSAPVIGAEPGQPAKSLPTPEEMAAAREDLWGEAAIRQPGGPSYEFFKDLLPPLRYANTDFRHYPLVLCAPRGVVQARRV